MHHSSPPTLPCIGGSDNLPERNCQICDGAATRGAFREFNVFGCRRETGIVKALLQA
jgi:hypothetical protein